MRTISAIGCKVSDMRFERGVTHYTVAHIPVAFPGDAIYCRYCPMCKLRFVGNAGAAVCMSTGSIINDIDNPPDDCPAEIKEDK